jgi:drug/metabolite transporter (DMT)-like permease
MNPDAPWFSGYQGELAAVATAFSWTASALAFTAAAVRLGSLSLNIIRLGLALAFFVALGWMLRGLPLPTDAAGHNWFWLSVSGLVGFTVGDLCLFRAFVLIGPRRTMLMMALVPMIGTVVSWVALGEGLAALAIVGMVLTMAGVAWVILERPPAAVPAPQGQALRTGVLLALGATVCQAAGLVLSKVGVHDPDYDAFAATEIRVIAGLAGFVVVVLAARGLPNLVRACRNRAGVGYATVGAFFGPFLGVAMSVVAVKYAKVGVAATIISIVPILIIPFMIVLYRERVSVRAVLGALVAVAGVALLFI